MNYSSETPAAPIRTGLLGFGLSGRVFHAPFIAADPRFTLSAIVTGNPGRREEAGRQHPDARLLDSADQLFEAADDLDLVVIGTPPATHHPLARAAIEAGLAVVVDKPFATTSAQGEELLALAASRGVALTVFQNRRWDSDFLTLRRLLADGSLPGVFRFESRFESFKPAGPREWKAVATVTEGGGILFDLGSHLLDQALQLFGPVDEVYSELARRHPKSTAEDDAFVQLRHASGVTSQLWMSSLAAQKGPRFRVLAETTGYTKWGLDGQEPALKAGALPTDRGFGVEPPSAWGVLGVDGADGSLTAVEPERGDYAAFYRLLGDALGTGTPLPVDPQDALQVLGMMERMHAAAGRA